MKALISAIPLIVCSAASVSAFDRQTTVALELCHSYLWEVPEFADLPNAAISVFPGLFDDNTITVFWNVYWDDPMTRVAGNCTIVNGALEGFENYLDLN